MKKRGLRNALSVVTEQSDDIRAYKTGEKQIVALAGDDDIYAGPGPGYYDGGDDTSELGGNPYENLTSESLGDTLSYRFAGNKSVNASLSTGKAERGSVSDMVLNIENLVGSVYNDMLEGDGRRNVLIGDSGNDTLYGLGGNDILDGDYDGDKIGGNDRIYGGEGDDIIYAGPGKDFIDGGSESGGNFFGKYGFISGDWLAYDDPVTKKLIVDLEVGYAQLGNSSKSRDTLLDIESVFGGSAADRLLGSEDFNTFLGYGGNDFIDGGGGGDHLEGGEGNDTLDGGPGDDLMFGDGGNDRISGGDGNDRLEGGDGLNWLTGGPGSDDFSHILRGHGGGHGNTFTNIVTDFEVGVDVAEYLFRGADSDNNGVLEDADLLVSIENFSLDGVSRPSTVILEKAEDLIYVGDVDGKWIFYGVTNLTVPTASLVVQDFSQADYDAGLAWTRF